MILENPFVPGILAYFMIGEPISNREWFIYFLATLGLVFISIRPDALQTRSVLSFDSNVTMETIGIAIVCVASGVQAVGIIAMR